MKLLHLFNKTALHVAVENEDEDMVKILLSSKSIDVNIPFIFKEFFFKYNSTSNILIKLEISF